MIEGDMVQITWLRVLKVWWSLYWRWTLLHFLTLSVIGLSLTLIMTLIGGSLLAIKDMLIIMGSITYIPIGIAVTKIVLRKKYSDFKLALITK